MHTQALSPAEIQQRVQELEPWFHNLNLGGVRTAPDHFLGDYPMVKFQGIRPCAAAGYAGEDGAGHRVQRGLLLP